MELPQTIEWAVHCCWLLAQTDGSPVPRRRLAEFFDLPEPYLAKLLKALVAAEVLSSAPGVNGGYRLARPAGQITVLDVVRAVNGHTAMFHCAEIRQRGPVGLTPAQCRRPCGIAKVMYEAELAWRNALAAVKVADLTENAAGVSAARAARWLGSQAAGREPPGLACADARTDPTGAANGTDQAHPRVRDLRQGRQPSPARPGGLHPQRGRAGGQRRNDPDHPRAL